MRPNKKVTLLHLAGPGLDHTLPWGRGEGSLLPLSSGIRVVSPLLMGKDEDTGGQGSHLGPQLSHQRQDVDPVWVLHAGPCV